MTVIKSDMTEWRLVAHLVKTGRLGSCNNALDMFGESIQENQSSH